MSGYQYDMLGNVEYDPDSSSSPRTRYYYNSNNLLSQVDYVNGGTTTTTTMTWDADQQRLRLANGTDTWEMLYDRVAGIPAVLLAKNYVSSSTSYEYYVRGPGGELLASFTDGETPAPHYYHFDQLGSMALLTNGSGTVYTSRTFSAWGTDLSGGASTSLPYQYVGELGYYSHIGTQGASLQNLLQLGVRFYDPEIGRFTQRDPIDGLNRYSYTGSRPVALTDEWGLYPKFLGCTDDQKKKLKKQVDDILANRLDCITGGRGLRDCIEDRLHNGYIRCGARRNEPSCAGLCGYTDMPRPPLRKHIHVCDDAFNRNLCGCLGKTIIHEFAHSCTPNPRNTPEPPEGWQCEYDCYGKGKPPCPK